MARRRGRPPGTTGRAAVLSPNQVRHAFRVARTRGRHAARAEAALAMSIGLGLRAKELAGLRWADVYDEAGKVRPVVHLKAAYTKGGRTRDVFVSSPALRRVLEKYGERDWLGSATDFAGGVVPQSEGRRDDGRLDGAVSQGALRRGRDSRRVLAQRAADADHAAGRARHRPEVDRRDRGPHEHPHDDDVHRGQPEAARSHPAGRDVVTSPGCPTEPMLRGDRDECVTQAHLTHVRCCG